VHLTPREIDKLLIFSAGELARKRRAGGVKRDVFGRPALRRT
jgi:urease gamma subunit